MKRAIAQAQPGENTAQEMLEHYKKQFIAALEDDLNTADALSAVFELVRELNIMAADSHTSREQLQAGLDQFEELISVLGLLYERKETETIPAQVLELVEQRKQARKQKDFAEADRIREEIRNLGYAVKETRQGVEISKL